MKEIIIEVKNVYGVLKAYPVCEEAKTFAKIAGSKTLTKQVLDLILQLHYTITVVSNNDYSQVA